jgi:uridine kinase
LDTRFARRLERDVRERGRTAQSVHEQFANQVGPMHDLHVEPSKTHADIVINSQQSESHYEQPLRLILSKILP